MTPERWRQITGVFHDALARDAETREPFLDEVCAGDKANGVVHRHFKAANVMVTASGSLKIVDFGEDRRFRLGPA